MKTLTRLALVATLAAFTIPASAQLSLLTSRASFPTTDTVNWGTLGAAFTTISSPFTTATTAGSLITVSHAEGALFERRDQTASGGWTGNFAMGDQLLWNRGDNGSMTFDPQDLISGAGFNVQADSMGSFSFRLDAYDSGGGLLGSVSRNGFSGTVAGTAIFIGFTSLTSNVDKFVATLVSSAGGTSNFAINTLALSAPAAPAAAAVPEPSVYGLLGALSIFGAVAYRRFRRHSHVF